MKTNNKLIENYRHRQEGYHPCLIGAKWQVTQFNYEPAYAFDVLKKLDVHHKSDEAFFLLKGEAVLVATKINENEIEFELSKVEPKILYNVPKGCLHNIALWKGTKVLINEDANTHLPLPDRDYEFHYLKIDEQNKLIDNVR